MFKKKKTSGEFRAGIITYREREARVGKAKEKETHMVAGTGARMGDKISGQRLAERAQIQRWKLEYVYGVSLGLLHLHQFCRNHELYS